MSNASGDAPTFDGRGHRQCQPIHVAFAAMDDHRCNVVEALVQDLLPLLDITQVELYPVTFVLHAGAIRFAVSYDLFSCRMSPHHAVV